MHALPTLPLPLTVELPASGSSRDQNEQDKNGDQGKAATDRGAIHVIAAVHGRILMGDQPDIRRVFMRRPQIIGDRLLLVDAKVTGVSANVAFVEDASGKEFELFVFQGAEQARSNLGRGGNFVERDASHLALPPQAFAEPFRSDAGLFKRLVHLGLARFFLESYELWSDSVNEELSRGSPIQAPLRWYARIRFHLPPEWQPPASGTTTSSEPSGTFCLFLSRCPSMSFPVADEGRQSYELKIFHDVAKALTSSLDLDTVLQTIMEKMAAYFEPATWSLLMLDENSKEFYYAAVVGAGCESINALTLTTGETLAHWVIEQGQPIIISDVNHDPRIQQSSNDNLFPDRCSVVCMPVRTGGKMLGIIQLINVNMEVYNRNELLLQTLADYAAIAIENARAVGRIQELSITDDCTGLFNARHLFTVLAEEVHRSERFGYEFSLLFLDLDHFKSVNDQHGHLIGSRLLAQVGEALRNNLRLVDAAFRYGGDEFAILLPQTSKAEALFVARRLMRVFHANHWLAGERANVALRASVGVATYPADGTTAQAVVRRADEMMYQVKQAGRDNIAVVGLGIAGLEGENP